MPDHAWIRELNLNRGPCAMRKRTLPKLKAVGGPVDDLVEHHVRVIVKSTHVCACQ
jgi:hypothetical protein